MLQTQALTQTRELDGLRAHAGALLARDRWSREQLLEHQRRRLRALLSYARRSSPYYREALGTAELPLEELPTLPKATLMAQFDRIVTDPRLRLADLEAHLAERDPARPFIDGYRLFSTAGSTGLRGVFIYSDDEFATWVAVCLRGLARFGVTGATRLVGIGAPGALHMSKQLFASFQRGREGVPQLSVLTPVPELVAALNAYQPEAVLTYPSVASLLAEEQLEGRLRIRPGVVFVGSEVLTEEARRSIHGAWAGQPFEVYAATEAPLIASSSRDDVGLHVTDDLLIVEIVDAHNRPVPPGQPGDKVLITNLVNRTQPLIRYELSDSVTTASGPDPSGRPYGRILRIEGRSDDIVRLPAPGGREVAVHPFRLRAPFARLPEVRQYQILHDGDGVAVRVVLRPSAPAGTEERIRAALLDELGSAGALAPPLEVMAVPVIEREPGDAAKLKLIKASPTN